MYVLGCGIICIQAIHSGQIGIGGCAQNGSGGRISSQKLVSLVLVDVSLRDCIHWVKLLSMARFHILPAYFKRN